MLARGDAIVGGRHPCDSYAGDLAVLAAMLVSDGKTVASVPRTSHGNRHLVTTRHWAATTPGQAQRRNQNQVAHSILLPHAGRTLTRRGPVWASVQERCLSEIAPSSRRPSVSCSRIFERAVVHKIARLPRSFEKRWIERGCQRPIISGPLPHQKRDLTIEDEVADGRHRSPAHGDEMRHAVNSALKVRFGRFGPRHAARVQRRLPPVESPPTRGFA